MVVVRKARFKSGPTALGFTYGVSNPYAKPESVPHMGPSKDAVKPFVRMLERVILAFDPRTG